MESDCADKPFRSFLISTCALAVCAFLWCAAFTFDAGDWPSPHRYPQNSPSANACGAVGAWAAFYLRHWLGDGAYPLLLFFTGVTVVRLLRGRVSSRWERALGLALLVAGTSASAHLLSPATSSPLPVGHGGVIGHALGELLHRNLDRLGTIIVLGAGLLVGIVFATEGWALKLPSFLHRAARVTGTATVAAQQVMRRSLATNAGVMAEEREALLSVRTPTRRRRPLRQQEEPDQPVLFDEEDPEADEGEYEDDEEGTEVEDAAEQEDEEQEGGDEAECTQPQARSKRKAEPPTGPIVNFPTAEDEAAAEPYPRQIENWRLPALDLLNEPEYGFDAQQEEVVRAQAKVLEQTLEDFRINARVVEIDTGPVITMFELKLGAGIKVSQIATLSNDIARALKASGIRVVAPISGKNTIGIEVPNVEKERVRLRELMTAGGRRAQEMSLPLFLGKDAGGATLVTDLTRMPHLLVAGTTGSGKSVSLNSIILSVLMTQRPDQVKLILIDPKMVELSHFKDVPHLMCPIVSDMARAEKILEWAASKMDERYALLAEARVKNIAAYNALEPHELFERLGAESEAEQARVTTFIPYMVIIIDELADLMMTAAREVEHHLSRLAQKSRAVGVHIIVATQRPEAKVVTGLVKSNLPSRICFRVASRMDSRIVLDRNGGEVLLGQGDMLFLPPGSHRLIRAQGTFLEDSEVQAVLEDLASRSEPEFHPELLRLRAPQADGRGELRDPLFDNAVGIVIQTKRGSASLLQRRLTIGYSRASRLIEQMAEAGIVGEYKGSQAREVLISDAQWKALRAQVAQELDDGYEADQDEYQGDDPGDLWDEQVTDQEEEEGDPVDFASDPAGREGR